MDARGFTNGMHLIPLDQDKEPTCGRGFLDEANYEQNTQKVIPGEMYGVLTGRPNRVLVVDWDCYGDKCEFELTEEKLTRKVGGEGAYIVKRDQAGTTRTSHGTKNDSAIGKAQWASKGSSISVRRATTWSVPMPRATSYSEETSTIYHRCPTICTVSLMAKSVTRSNVRTRSAALRKHL